MGGGRRGAGLLCVVDPFGLSRQLCGQRWMCMHSCVPLPCAPVSCEKDAEQLPVNSWNTFSCAADFSFTARQVQRTPRCTITRWTAHSNMLCSVCFISDAGGAAMTAARCQRAWPQHKTFTVMCMYMYICIMDASMLTASMHSEQRIRQALPGQTPRTLLDSNQPKRRG